MKFSFDNLKKYKLPLGIILIVVLGVVYASSGKTVSPYETSTVKRTNIVQEVTVTGRVNSESLVELAFEKGGRVSQIPTLVGGRVTMGTPLVRLDVTELSTLRAQARANLDYEIANLAQLTSGVRKEDIAVSEAKLASARVTQNNAFLGVVDKIRGAYTAADDAVRTETDVVWRNPRTPNPEFNIPVTDSRLVTSLPPLRVAIESKLKDLELISRDASSVADATVAVEQLARAEDTLSLIKEYLNDLSLAMSSIAPSASISQTTIDTYKASVASARSSVVTTLTALLGADKDMRAANSAVAIAENELVLKRSGPTPEALAGEEAKVASARATLANYDAQIEKATLRAPFAGIVTKNDAKIGETVSPNVPIVSMMMDGKWKVEANVPEVDVAKISLGDEARITLDAYGSDVPFAATVGFIDPAETILEGVSTYKVTLYFKDTDTRIRSGMTANITISTNKREGVLAIPARAVTTKEGKKIVRVLVAGAPVDREVELGLRGSDGQVEVTSGLAEGEAVVTFEKTK